MASSATQVRNFCKGNGPIIVTIDVVADTDGSVSDIPLDASVNNYLKEYGFYLFAIDTYPDDTIPMTDNYDVYIKNSLGKDLMGGNCENRSNSSIQEAMPAIVQIVDDDLTISISNNIVNSGETKMKLFFAKY